jgi:mitogen-activated protein kinase organizer 1
MPISALLNKPRAMSHTASTVDSLFIPSQDGAVPISCAGGYCLTGSKDRSVRLWNPSKALQINIYRGNGGDVRGLAVAQDNRTFLSCGTDRLVNHFDVATGSVLRRFSGHDAAVNAVCFAADESLAISTSYDATVRFWDMKGRNTRPVDVAKVATDSVTGLAVPSAVPLVVTSAVDGTVAVIDIRKGVIVKDDMHVPVSTVAVPEDALYIVAACTDNAVRLLDRNKGAVIGTYTGHQHQNFQIECGLICNDSVAVCGSEDGACAFSL